jgi:hypothetical protein
MRQLRDAAVVGKTKLLLVDQVVKYACKDENRKGEIRVPEEQSVPEGLLPNVRPFLPPYTPHPLTNCGV